MCPMEVLICKYFLFFGWIEIESGKKYFGSTFCFYIVSIKIGKLEIWLGKLKLHLNKGFFLLDAHFNLNKKIYIKTF